MTTTAPPQGPGRTGRARRAAEHPVRTMILNRSAWGALSIVAAAAIVYFATLVLPGDAAAAILGQQATPERLELLREQLGLNQPPVQGFISWFTGLLRGDFGTSLTNQQPVWDLIRPRMVNSAVLVVVTAVISTLLGMLLGALAAARRDRVLDHSLSVVALTASALPEFIVGVFVVLLLGITFPLFPAISVLPPGTLIWEQPDKAVLPVLTLVIVVTPYVLRMTRASIIEALQSDYAEVATLKGASPTRVLFRHAVPNAMAPTVQVVGLNLLYLAGGIVLVETVFQYPGIGLSLVDAISNRDIPVIQFLVVALSFFYVVLNIATDVVVLLLTPRRRLPR